MNSGIAKHYVDEDADALAVPDNAVPDPLEAAAPSAIPRQPGAREIAPQQQGQLAAPLAPDSEPATGSEQAVPSIAPPGSLNGSAPPSGEDS